MANRSIGQICNNRYSGHIYKSMSFDTITHVVSSPENEVIAVGNNLEHYGFIAGFSPKGNPLFSYEYQPIYQNNRTYFSNLTFSDIIHTKDGSFLAAGNIVEDRIAYMEYINNKGVLIKIDKYGNIIWSKKFESVNGVVNSGFNLAITNVLETATGDLIIYLASDYGKYYYSYGKIICLSSAGVEKWSTLLASGGYDGSVFGLTTKRALSQSQDKSIIVGDVIYQADRLQPVISLTDAQFHFFALDPTTGMLNWETNYQFPLQTPPATTNINNASELPDGKLVFTTSLYISGSQIPLVKKAVRITTNNKGQILNTFTYNLPANNATEFVNVMRGSNSLYSTYLLKCDSIGILANINNSGQILWQQGYNNANGQFPVNCASSIQNGYAIFMSNLKTHFSRLLLTDSVGIDCDNANAQLIIDSANLNQGQPIITDISTKDPNPFAISDFSVRNLIYPLERSIECEELVNCCTDVIDNINIPEINICEGDTYQLPDGKIVKDAGTYFVQLKTSRGCDSIRFFHLHVNKNPSKLMLGKDTCFEGTNTITLHATGGYTSYLWMNNISISDSAFKVYYPGTYYVSVSNACGRHSDSITVYKQCDFPIYIPNAFTPNNDRLNDKFGVPPGNKNIFISLKIFNRWGQVVFQSNDSKKGWNGTFNSQPLNTDIFIYLLEMKGLSGNSIVKRGTVLLIK